MTKIRLAKGLLDAGPEETRGIEWDWAPPDDDWVPGMGLGASEEAILWAKIGREYLRLHALKELQKNATSLKSVELRDTLDKDCVRALLCYREVHSHPNRRPSSWTNRELIDWARTDDYAAKYFTAVDATLEPSLSRGKDKLNITDNWESSVCEKLWQSVSQT